MFSYSCKVCCGTVTSIVGVPPFRDFHKHSSGKKLGTDQKWLGGWAAAERGWVISFWALPRGWVILKTRVVQFPQTDSNEITFMLLVFHGWNASHYGDLNISVGFRMCRGAFYLFLGPIGTISTNGIPFIPSVKCISLWRLRIFPLASGCVEVHSSCPLVRLVWLVPVE